MKQKCLYSIIALFFVFNNAFAQWAVTDPVLTSLTELSWAKDLEQAAKQFSVLDKSKNILTESIDLYKKVNGVIRNGKTVINVLARQGDMLKVSAQECTRNDIYSEKAYTEYTKRINDLMDQSIVSFDLLKVIISDDMKMTDGERLKIILDLDTKTQETQNRLLDERNRFNTVNNAIKRISALKSKK